MNNITKLNSLILLLASLLVSHAVSSAEYEAVITLPQAHELSMPVSAMVDKVNVRAGQHVVKGEEIIALDQAPFVAAKARAKANLTVNESVLKQAKRDLKHYQELFDRTVLSTVELEDVEMREQRARAHLADAKVQLEVAEYNLSYSKLLAPFDAMVLAVHVNPGQYLNNEQQSQPLVSLVRQGDYLVTFDVPAEALEKIKIGQDVTVTVKGEIWPAKIFSINYQTVENVKQKEKLYSVAAKLVATDNDLHIGLKSTVKVN